MEKSILLYLLIFSFLLTKGQDTKYINFMEHIRHLASDVTQGRYPGTKGDSISAEYISEQFNKARLKPFWTDYYQRFDLMVGAEVEIASYMHINNDSLEIYNEFVPLAFSKDTLICSNWVNVGYGLDFKHSDGYYSNYTGIDVKNKWVIINYNIPSDLKNKAGFSSGPRMRAVTARSKGAAGVIFLNKTSNIHALLYDKSAINAGIPVVMISKDALEKRLGNKILNNIISEPKENGKVKKTKANSTICINSKLRMVNATSFNITGYIEGNDNLLKNEFIVIGGHYDHLGLGGPGSGSRMPDSIAIHYGADDNASGVAGVIELANYFSINKTSRSLIFVAFGAEEQGLLGSKYFTENSPVPIENIKAMFNFDMIGRMHPERRTLSIAGMGSALESDSILKHFHDTSLFNLRLSPEARGGSDHAPFYHKGIPVFFFITGMHDDYHTPIDTWEKIDSSASYLVLDYAKKIIANIANSNQSLTFTETKDKTSSSRHSNRIALGITPDPTGSNEKGLLIEAVRNGGPAQKGGLLKDDILISINSDKISDIYDYMNKLSTLKKGDTIEVEIIRKENGLDKNYKFNVEL